MSPDLKDRLRQFISTRQRQYQQTFAGPVAEHVLRDLARFCRANESTFHADPRAHALAEGRREVWLRIQNHLNLTPAQLWQLTSGESD